MFINIQSKMEQEQFHKINQNIKKKQKNKKKGKEEIKKKSNRTASFEIYNIRNVTLHTKQNCNTLSVHCCIRSSNCI